VFPLPVVFPDSAIESLADILLQPNSEPKATEVQTVHELTIERIDCLVTPFDIQAVNCSLQFFAADSYDVVGSSFTSPSAAIINFDPPSRQTTSRKRRYPNSVYTLLLRYERTRLREIEIQFRRLFWFNGGIIDGSLQNAVYEQGHSVSAWREWLRNVAAVVIRFNARRYHGPIFRFDLNVRALDRMAVRILNDTFQH
jgi:hypothetical protein